MASDYLNGSKDTLTYVSGPQHLRTVNAHLPSRGGVSHQWKGPGTYCPEIKRFGLPDPAAVSEKQVTGTQPRTTGYLSADCRAWTRDHVGPILPPDSRMLINEEDWHKYQLMGRGLTPAFLDAVDSQLSPLRNHDRRFHHKDYDPIAEVIHQEKLKLREKDESQRQVSRFGYKFYF